MSAQTVLSITSKDDKCNAIVTKKHLYSYNNFSLFNTLSEITAHNSKRRNKIFTEKYVLYFKTNLKRKNIEDVNEKNKKILF